MTRICLWSGPRNVSTALMYSFRQRADTSVVDEPFYAHYLAWSGADHPGADEVLAAQSTDAPDVVDSVIFGAYPTRHVFFKQMAHHLQGMDRGWIDGVANVVLTREPAGMLRSLTEKLGTVTVAETSLPIQVELVDSLADRGDDPVVVVAHELLADPPAMIEALCDRMGLMYDPAMLSWPAGPKPEDGVWAKHWYHGVHESTGFASPRPPAGPLSADLQPLLAQCQDLYDRLLPYALTPG